MNITNRKKSYYQRLGSHLRTTLFFLSCCTAHSANAGQYDIKGEWNLDQNTVGNCTFNSAKAKYSISFLFGEPIVNGSYKYETDGCSLPQGTNLYIKLATKHTSRHVRISPVVPKPNGGFGYNVSGSPHWAKFLCSGLGKESSDNCMKPEEAKHFIKSRPNVVDAILFIGN